MDRTTLLAPIPDWLIDLAGKKPPDRPENAETPLTPYDQPHNTAQAIRFLQSADIAVQGDAGDSMTLKTACWVRDYAISQGQCLEIMSEHWNERCEPPWPISELAIKIANAYRYAQNRPGGRCPEIVFTPLPPFVEPEISDITWLTLFDTINDVLTENLEPNWLIKNYIERQSTVLMYGEHSSMKSFIALDMALCVSLGHNWCGLKTKQGPVFYIAGEGRPGVKKRLRAWCKVHPDIDPRHKPFFPSKGPVYFDNLASVNTLVQNIQSQVATVGAPELIIIDTLSKNIGALDESSSRDMGMFIKYLEQHIRNVFGCTIIIIHHCGHGKKDRARGASTLPAGVDAMYLVVRKEEAMGTRLCQPSKMKEGEPPPGINFDAKVIKLGQDTDGDSITSLVLTPSLRGNADPTVFICNDILDSRKAILLALIKDKPRSNQVTATDSVWSLQGFTDKGRLKALLDNLLGEGLIALTEGRYT